MCLWNNKDKINWYFRMVPLPNEDTVSSFIPVMPAAPPIARSDLSLALREYRLTPLPDFSIADPSITPVTEERPELQEMIQNSPFVLKTPGSENSWTSFIPPSPFLQRPASPIIESRNIRKAQQQEKPPLSEEPIKERVLTPMSIASSPSISSLSPSRSPSPSFSPVNELSTNTVSAYCPASPVYATDSW